MLTAALDNDNTLQVELAPGGHIRCGTHGGNLRVKSKNNAGNPLKITWQWTGAPPRTFRLQFQALPLEGDADPPENTPFWPFVETEPEDGLTNALATHTYTLKQTDFVCKYSIVVGTLRLDPIIIVEKKA
jgi:hypothetical protein